MYKKITEFLYCFGDYEWHQINDLLKELFGDNDSEARKILVALCEAKRIEIKDRRHLALTTSKNITGYDPQNTQVTFDNWPIEAKLTEEEREKIATYMQQPSPKDYKFEILAFLYKQGNETVNIRPFIDDLVSEGYQSGVWFGTQLSSMRTKKHIWFDDVLCLSWVGNSHYSATHPIKARIEPDGIAEYKRLDALYNPPPPVTHVTNITTHGKHSPAAGRDVHQATGKNDKEGIRLSRQQLIWTIVGILLATVLGILALCR
jgi:hypothetical protein